MAQLLFDNECNDLNLYGGIIIIITQQLFIPCIIARTYVICGYLTAKRSIPLPLCISLSSLAKCSNDEYSRSFSVYLFGHIRTRYKMPFFSLSFKILQAYTHFNLLRLFTSTHFKCTFQVGESNCSNRSRK